VIVSLVSPEFVTVSFLLLVHRGIVASKTDFGEEFQLMLYNRRICIYCN